MAWESDPPHLQPSKGYLRVRRVNRAIMETWFREISTVDVDTLPEDGGIIYTAWHPGGLIDPMLMMAALPGGLTFTAKSTLFKIPVLSRIMKWIDVQPVEREQDGVASPEERKKANSKLIDTLAELVANGERIAIFPEGMSHTESYAVELKTGAARILLEAHRRAVAKGKPTPNIVPIGLHYSDQHSFRERVSLQINRPLKAPPLPQTDGSPQPSEEELVQHGEEAHDRAWCKEVTSLLQTEINRTSHAQESWEDRELVWRARRMIHTIRSGENVSKISYNEAVLGSRRVRAAWQYFSVNDPDRTEEIETKFKEHHKDMERIQLRSWELQDRRKKISKKAFFRNLAFWIWSASWMLGFVTWSAMIATGVPYLFVRFFVSVKASRQENKAGIGSMKLLYSIGLYPLWWLFCAITLGWFIASASSPLQDVNLPGYILPVLAAIPWMLVSIILLFWWPVSARLHLKLYQRLSKSWKNLRLWFKLRSGQIEWESLIQSHQALAMEMASIGDGLILPGDPDWQEPPAGKDDWEMVQFRPSEG
ncbi:MAG: 1-acyl-sn-glycerol-3-phosphate acyltransferase [Candidatus Thermoplasmatota archaeon]|nr:1-acyl-sn-glycerol-3-phosphate acyltransferase [Candidatus Thermoplasmatota archaeon]